MIANMPVFKRKIKKEVFYTNRWVDVLVGEEGIGKKCSDNI